jgi:hypothetical protein
MFFVVQTWHVEAGMNTNGANHTVALLVVDHLVVVLLVLLLLQGCATKFCNGNFDVGVNVTGDMTVCHYSPQGNVLGRFKQNVRGQTRQQL